MASVYIGIGSNIDPEANIRAAIRLLADKVDIIDISTFYLTAAVDRPEQPAFVNGAVHIDTDVSPDELKYGILRSIEQKLGRTRTDDRSASRTIDLDILVYDTVVICEGDMVIPDPEIARRPFLLIPLYQLDSGLVLPGTGIPISELAGLFAHHGMTPLREFTEVLRDDLHERSKGREAA